ncbi:jg17729 [Pararge aegeria aegeria]|uniref:Jg17729 protein n=1 Tax=Pararge aegeria aegeria TaxID=348720 RepID=A0A8S4S936_9NEOP|nr:jg17729 [Pararge aegeria aegeria]
MNYTIGAEWYTANGRVDGSISVVVTAAAVARPAPAARRAKSKELEIKIKDELFKCLFHSNLALDCYFLCQGLNLEPHI